MNSLAVWTSEPYRNDELFNVASRLNRDDCLACFRALRDAVTDAGGRCHTQDLFLRSGEVPEVVLFLDVPVRSLAETLGKWAGRTRPWLLLQEPPTVRPENWEPERHRPFERVFTWHGGLVDGGRYVKLNYCFAFVEPPPVGPEDKTGFCAVIAANKGSRHPLELYSERRSAIRWFEANHPGEFALYGVGWNERVFAGPRPVRALNRIRFIRRLLAERFPSYRGTVADKRSILKNYRFSLCYENIRDMPGYITEKIFDCFFAGCVPVYWGANDVADHIPPDCFIDRRAFPTHEALYAHLKGMNDNCYRGHQERIREFLHSPSAYPFSAACFAETIVAGWTHG